MVSAQGIWQTTGCGSERREPGRTRAWLDELDTGRRSEERLLRRMELANVRGVLVRLQRRVIGVDLVEDPSQLVVEHPVGGVRPPSDGRTPPQPPGRERRTAPRSRSCVSRSSTCCRQQRVRAAASSTSPRRRTSSEEACRVLAVASALTRRHWSGACAAARSCRGQCAWLACGVLPARCGVGPGDAVVRPAERVRARAAERHARSPWTPSRIHARPTR